MADQSVYILGGMQTDFADNVARSQRDIFDLFKQATEGALSATKLEANEIETAHIGNFVGELFAGQGQLGGFLGHVHPDLAGVPAARHEAACASGSIAILAASSEIEAQRYDVALVLGIELMRNVPGQTAAEYLGAAAWVGKEAQSARYVWPAMFSDLEAEYASRYGLDRSYLRAISQNNFSNAKRNPNAQTRNWTMGPEQFAEDDNTNPTIEGTVRKSDCGQVTDGASAIILASAEFAKKWAQRNGMAFEHIPKIKGWGHTTAPLLYSQKVADSADQDVVFPHVRTAMQQALSRASLNSIYDVDSLEVHDCFSITEYMALDHFGLTPPGQSWRAIEDGVIEMGGRLPVNPSGGLIGLGHPVGATGVRMMLDSYKQVTEQAGDYQVAGAKTVASFNVGGSATTSVCFVVGQ